MDYGLEFIGLYYSTYRGFVSQNNDPKKMNRLQLIIPHLDPVTPYEYWAWPSGMWGGENHGVQMIPSIGDMVWIEFENGNADYPVWKHAGYAESELPTDFATVNHYGFKTPQGSILVINDNKGEEEILVRLNSELDWVKITKNQIENESKLIKLGKNGDEWAVLGETLLKKMETMAEKLDTTYQTLITHTHPSNAGVTGPPIQAPALNTQKLELEQLKITYKEWLSGKVKIDK